MIRKTRFEKIQLEKVLIFVDVPLPRGSGVPQEHLKRIFTKFFHEDIIISQSIIV